MWTHLERQRGGIGLRGPGEREIETDRRVIRDKIARLRKQLKIIDKQKSTQRSHRGKLVRVALVGYTNAGKSTLMNRMSKSNVLAENKLFATLDTTVRKTVIKNLPFLLTDTVGFIHKLPHCLVESFKATLDEVREADLLLHIVDSSHPEHETQIQIVKDTLEEIGAHNKPYITVFNKIDSLDVEKDEKGIPAVTSLHLPKGELPVFISAKKKTNIDGLKEILYEQVMKIHITRYPYSDFLY
jgi:GTP-binding protein HflX